MSSTVTVSASVEVPNDSYMECRVDMNRDVAILNEPIPTDPKTPRPVVISRGSELHHPQP